MRPGSPKRGGDLLGDEVELIEIAEIQNLQVDAIGAGLAEAGETVKALR